MDDHLTLSAPMPAVQHSANATATALATVPALPVFLRGAYSVQRRPDLVLGGCHGAVVPRYYDCSVGPLSAEAGVARPGAAAAVHEATDGRHGGCLHHQPRGDSATNPSWKDSGVNAVP